MYFTTLFSTVSIKVHKDISWNPDLLLSTHRSWNECIILEQQSPGSVLIQCNLTKNNAVQNPYLLVFNCWNTLTISFSVYAKRNGLTVNQNSHIVSNFTTFWTLGSCRIQLQLKWSWGKKGIWTAHLPNLWSNFSSWFTPFCLAQSPHALILVHSSIFHCLPPSETCRAPQGSQITHCLLLSSTVCS